MAIQEQGVLVAYGMEQLALMLIIRLQCHHALLICHLSGAFVELPVHDALANLLQGVLLQSLHVAEEAAVRITHRNDLASEAEVGMEQSVSVVVGPLSDIVFNVSMPVRLIRELHGRVRDVQYNGVD